MQYNRRLIIYLFHLLFIFVPLIFWTKNSELFEFNKMLTVYALTVLITATWLTDIIISKKIIFKRTAMDIPIILFLGALTLSTLISIDQRTSILGYYSRFHGGLISYACYSLLYWAAVTYLDKPQTLKLIRTLLIVSGVASIYAALEHFGISISCLFVTGELDTKCWVQDVQHRVFGTFGQPNWLAAWLVAILPLTWLPLSFWRPKADRILLPLLGALFFTTLLFTKSRSGLLAFGVSYVIYWGLSFTTPTRAVQSIMPWLTTFYILLATILIGTPWTPNLNHVLKKPGTTAVSPTITETGTVLERGGTESGNIRKIVWRGALDLWKKYPVLGTGTDTFALSYYETRPVEHNHVSEWNFLYNRAHNEYLNFMATTGTLGILTYMTLIATSLYIFIKSLGQLEQLEIRSIAIALLSGYVSILITNFFGFSTVPVAILFFLFPALATSLTQERKKRTTTNSTPQHTRTRAVLSIMPWLTTCYLLMAIGRYWYADIKYNEGKNLNRAERYSEAAQALRQAVKLTPNEAIFHDELADSYSQIAQVMYHNNQADLANTAITLSIEEINKTTQSSPHDIKLLKTKTATLADLGSLNPQYYSEAIKYLEILKSLAPTEPTAHYRLALNHARLGDNEKAAEFLQEAILLKPDYEQARLFLGLLYEDLGEPEMAKEQYQYILDNINPNNGVAGDNLQELNKPQ